MMELVQQKPSVWGALLWKDFQQVRQTFMAVLAGVFCVQFILLISGVILQIPENRMALFGGTVTMACVAPILLALGCSGMLIGQERQSGTWAWSSSLPVSWFQALSSKLMVSVVGSLVASIPLMIIPIGLMTTRQLETGASSVAATYVSWLTLVIFLEVVVFCFLSAALFRETLTALVVAGIGLAVVQIYVGNALSEPSRQVASNGGAAFLYAIFVSGMLLAGFLLMTIAFRWRWGIGQQSAIAFWRSSNAIQVPFRVNFQYASGNAPSEWWMHLRHSMSNSFWLRMVVLIGLYFLTLLVIPRELNFIALLLAMGILGITAFEGDQTLNRFRFLADRGVNPWKLTFCRIAHVSILASVACAAFALCVGRFQGGSAISREIESALWLSPLAFLIGVFSSLCFRKSIMAMMAALVICFVGFVASVLAIELVQFDHYSILELKVDFAGTVMYCTPISSLMLLAAVFAFARRWLVLDEPKIALHFVWISLSALLSPVLVACTFGFLFIPIVPLQDMGAVGNSSSAGLSSSAIPDLLSSNEPTMTDSLPQLSILSQSRGLGLQGVSAAAINAIAEVLVSQLGIVRQPRPMSAYLSLSLPSFPSM